VAQLNLDEKLQLGATPLRQASKVNNTCAMARTRLDFAPSPQVRRAANSLYYRQYAFLKLPPHEVQKIADIKDTLSNSEPVLKRQGLQQFPERVVCHFKPGERQGFSVSLAATSLARGKHDYTDLAKRNATWSADRSCWPQVVGLLEYASVHILDAIAMSTHLGLTAGAFRGIIDTPSQTPSSSSLDVIQYLPVAETVSSFKTEGGCALHHDRGLLTLIWSDTVEGLQVNLMLPLHPYKHALLIANYA